MHKTQSSQINYMEYNIGQLNLKELWSSCSLRRGHALPDCDRPGQGRCGLNNNKAAAQPGRLD